MSPPPGGPVFHQRLAMPLSDATVRYEHAADLDAQTLDALIELLRRSFDGGPSWFATTSDPRDHLRWKTVDRPGGAVVEFTELEGHLVGMRVEGAAGFMVRGRATQARHGSDVAIDPRYQGMRISTARNQYRESVGEPPGVDFGFAVGTHPASPLMRPEGTRSIIIANHIDTLARPLGLRTVLAARRRNQARADTVRGAEASGDGTAGARRLLTSEGARSALRLASTLVLDQRSRPRRGTAVRSSARFDARADSLSLEAARVFDLIQVRDQDYLNWRFHDPRGGRFVVRVVEEGPTLLGYCALRLTPENAVLADLLALPGRDDVLRALLRDASRVAASRRLPYLRAWLPRHHPYRAALEREGFIPYPNELRVGITPASSDAEIATIAADPTARIHFMIADTDHV